MGTRNPGDVLFRADRLSRENRHREAAEVLASAIGNPQEDAPAPAILLYNYGLELLALGESDSALKSFVSAAESNPEDPDIWNEIARIHLDNRRLNAAKQALEKALRLSGEHPNALNNLGVHHFLRGRYSEAVEAFKAAVQNNPDLAEAWYNLADALDETGDKKGASKARSRYRKMSDY